MKRRWIMRAAIFLIVGAIANVAVAWTCALPHGESDRDQAIDEVLASSWFQQFRDDANVQMHSVQITSSAFADTAIVRARVAQNPNNFDSVAIARCRAGWPLLALAGERTCTFVLPEQYRPATYHTTWALVADDRIASNTAGILPIRPLWPGFVINAMFYATVSWLIYMAPSWHRHQVRRLGGLCSTCAYPIGTSAVCTECGKPLRRGRV